MDKPNFDCMNVWNKYRDDLSFKMNVGKEVYHEYVYPIQIDMNVTKNSDGSVTFTKIYDSYDHENKDAYKFTPCVGQQEPESKFPLQVEVFGYLLEVDIDPTNGDWVYIDTDTGNEKYRFTQACMKDSYLKEYTLKFGEQITKNISDKSIPELTKEAKDVISNQDVYPVTSNVITGYFPKFDNKAETKAHSHYFKDVSNYSEIDVYRVLDLFEVTNPCIQHAIKKLLKPGERGVKSVQKDLNEAIDSINRALEMMKEDENV